MKNCTKILMIAPQPFYEDRGTPIVILKELKILCQLGYQVDVATFPIGNDIRLPGVNIIRTINPMQFKSVAVGFSLRKLIMDFLLLFTVLGLSRKQKYICIHGVEEGAAIAIACKSIFGIPIIYDMHSSIPDQLIKFKLFRSVFGQKIAIFFEKFLIDHADSIIASAGLGEHVLSKAPKKAVWECLFPVFDEKSDCVPLDCKIDPKGRPTIVYAGNFSFYQGLDLLIEAAKILLLARNDILIILLGGSEYDTQPIASLIQKYELDEVIKIHNKVHRTQVADFLSIADALVLPRRHGKNVPLKLYEYMKSKKPIVATDIPAHTALLNNTMALLVKPDAEALAKGLLRVIQDKDLGNSLAEEAYFAALAIKNNILKETLYESYRHALKKCTQFKQPKLIS